MVYGLEFLLNVRQISQTELANILQVSPQTVYKWVKRIRKIPKGHRELIGKALEVDPMYLDQFLSAEEMVYILSGKWLDSDGDSDSGVTMLQKENLTLKKQKNEMENRIENMEKEVDVLHQQATILERYLYSIEDESMRKMAKEMLKSVDRLHNLTKGIDHLL